ncbi:hypothetical protein ACFV06_10430 [Streptomyces sp. NPDC059618]|uniref:hypothetical protein n=1 Tax=Streptomyces sp. NPDC059618 TaxID=3346887 RepID=UPI0036B748BF
MNHVLSGLAANTALPSELVDRLIAVADADVADELAGREDLRHAQAVALFARARESGVRLAYMGKLTAADVDPVADPDTALALLDEGRGSPEWARVLVVDPVAWRREKLAACRGLPDDVVETLAADSERDVVVELALWTTAAAVARLADHPHAEVRRAVAANEATPPPVLAALLLTGEGPGASRESSQESGIESIQVAALRNPATPTEAVVGFADHPATWIRRTLAARPDLPPQVCLRLAADPVPGVRADLAENPAIGEDVIRVLAGDGHRWVRRSLAYHPRVPIDVLIELAATSELGGVRLPRVSAASRAEMEELARSRDPEVRALVAQRRDLSPAIRDALACDPDAKVVKSVAPHRGLTEGRLRAMADRYGVMVLAKVAANPDATPELLEHLARRSPPLHKVFKEIARHRNASADALIACLADRHAKPPAALHPALPPRVIVQLLSDPEPRVAGAAAANPSLPRTVMEDLVARLETPAGTSG